MQNIIVLFFIQTQTAFLINAYQLFFDGQNLKIITKNIFRISHEQIRNVNTSLKRTHYISIADQWIEKKITVQENQKDHRGLQLKWGVSLTVYNQLNISSMNTKLILVIFAMVMLSASALRLQTHEGKFAYYTFNEAKKKNRCGGSDQCDGLRTCSFWNKCQGTARPPKDENYRYNEMLTLQKCPKSATERDYANRQYYCDGNKTCNEDGWCEGYAR